MNSGLPGEPLFHLLAAERSARRLRRKVRDALHVHEHALAATDEPPVTRIVGEPVVGDLSERVFALVGARGARLRVEYECQDLAREVTEWGIALELRSRVRLVLLPGGQG